ncbi:MAG: hypothetical protein R3E84_07935 [Pseudomonadales bacterium]
MIKSKLGFRVSLMRANTGFLAGILVMLGLLGTFLGLLNTIDSIGIAMSSMSSIGDADPEAMSAFLASIAAPLKGMGLAFSSSLFGLSGSLLISFVNYLCGGVHDRFIENCSRWIDDRIPTPSQEARKAEADPKVASSDELKAWLAGFVQTATHTNRHIETLVGSIAEQLTAMQSVMRNNRALFALNKSNHDELKELRRGYARGLSVVRKEINDRAVELSRKLNASRNQGAAVEAIASTTGDTIQAAQARTVQESQEQLSMLVDELQTLLEEQQVVQEMRARHDDTLQGLPPTLRDSTPLQPNENPER